MVFQFLARNFYLFSALATERVSGNKELLIDDGWFSISIYKDLPKIPAQYEAHSSTQNIKGLSAYYYTSEQRFRVDGYKLPDSEANQGQITIIYRM